MYWVEDEARSLDRQISLIRRPQAAAARARCHQDIMSPLGEWLNLERKALELPGDR